MPVSVNNSPKMVSPSPLVGLKWSRDRLYWTCQTAGWYGQFLLILLMYALAYPPGTVRDRIGAEFVFATSGVLSTHIFRTLARRFHWQRTQSLGATIQVIVAAVPFVASMVTGALFLYSELTGKSTITANGSFFTRWIVVGYSALFFTLQWFLIYFGFHYFERQQQEQQQRMQASLAEKDAQMRALLMQLNPHFVFNCLNSIRAQVTEDPASAQRMITALSQILRHTLGSGKNPTVPLRDEMASVNAYLELEQVRLEDRLRTEIDVTADCLACAVPPMLVQMLVENAIKHGIATLRQGGELHVSIHREDDELKILVQNSGHLDPDRGDTRVGLANLRDRLRLLFGDEADLVIASAGNGTVRVDVNIPTNGVENVTSETPSHQNA